VFYSLVWDDIIRNQIQALPSWFSRDAQARPPELHIPYTLT